MRKTEFIAEPGKQEIIMFDLVQPPLAIGRSIPLFGQGGFDEHWQNGLPGAFEPAVIRGLRAGGAPDLLARSMIGTDLIAPRQILIGETGNDGSELGRHRFRVGRADGIVVVALE